MFLNYFFCSGIFASQWFLKEIRSALGNLNLVSLVKNHSDWNVRVICRPTSGHRMIIVKSMPRLVRKCQKCDLKLSQFFVAQPVHVDRVGVVLFLVVGVETGGEELIQNRDAV